MKFDINIHVHNHSLSEARIMAALNQIQENISMSAQDTINALTEKVNQAKEQISQKISEETQQVKKFIDEHPELDTSALEGAVEGLSSIGESVDSIMADPAPAPPAESPAEPAPEA